MDLRFADHIFFAYCRFANWGPNYFFRHETSPNRQIHNFSPYKYKLKSSHVRFKGNFWDSFRQSNMAFCSL